MAENLDQSRFFTASTPLLSVPTLSLGSARTVPTASLCPALGETKTKKKDDEGDNARSAVLNSRLLPWAIGRSIRSLAASQQRHPGTHSHSRATAGRGAFSHLPDREQNHQSSSSKLPDPPRQTRRPMPSEPSGPEAFPLPTWRLLASAWSAAIRDLARNAMWSDLA
jgi:hypothetical protein